MAKKYIDADRLKAKIEELEGLEYPCDNSEQNVGFENALDRVSDIIDSLQQEQPCDTCTNDKGCVTCKDGELWEGKEVDLEAEMEKEIKEHYYDDQDVYWWNYLKKSFRHFFILGIKATCNTPMKQITLNELATEGISDVEEAAEKYEYEKGHLYHPSIKEIFIAGAEWQEEKDTRDMYMSDNRHYEKVYELGKKDMKKKMLEDAVERTVKIDSGGYPYIDITAELYDYEHNVPLAKEGDLVKIIIVPEKDEEK